MCFCLYVLMCNSVYICIFVYMRALRVLCRAEVELSQLIRHCVCNGHLHTDPYCNGTVPHLGIGHLCNGCNSSMGTYTMNLVHTAMGTSALQWAHTLSLIHTGVHTQCNRHLCNGHIHTDPQCIGLSLQCYRQVHSAMGRLTVL